MGFSTHLFPVNVIGLVLQFIEGERAPCPLPPVPPPMHTSSFGPCIVSHLLPLAFKTGYILDPGLGAVCCGSIDMVM